MSSLAQSLLAAKGLREALRALRAGWDVLTTGRYLLCQGGCRSPWAWEQDLAYFGTPLHKRTGLHMERLDSAAGLLAAMGSICSNTKCSCYDDIWE